MNLGLNSFRFFAFLLVFLTHSTHLFPFGYLGVQAFFVLSGFLITPILIQTKEKYPSLKDFLKNFLTRRFLRIFPLYYFYLLVITLAILVFNLDNYEYFASLKRQLIYAFTYTYNFYHQTKFYEHNMFISHFWSLAVEEQFYLFWPFLIFFFTKNIKSILIFICFINPIVRYFTGYIVDHDLIPILLDRKDLVVYVSTFSHIDAFALGSLFGILPKIHLKSYKIITVCLATVLLGLSINLFVENNLNFKSLGYPPFMKGSYRYVWGYSLLNLCFALILVGLKNRTFFPKLFENKMLASLGLVSYGLYIYHTGILWLVSEFITNNYILNVLVSFLLTIAVSYLSFYLFEKRFIDLKDKIAPKK
ncbi:MAG: acyltransferase [Flavobacteriales bacterium]|nr:acyltransferase [Flavobacteriales bacterium]